MFTRLTDTSKAMVFTVLVLFFALAAGLTINVRQPEHGIVGELTSFLLQVILYSLTFVLAEEIGWRGYLLPHLLSVGRSRSLVLVGLIQAAWHMPLISSRRCTTPRGTGGSSCRYSWAL
jgi:membrane protease YdiL (CAAX protease family)